MFMPKLATRNDIFSLGEIAGKTGQAGGGRDGSKITFVIGPGFFPSGKIHVLPNGRVSRAPSIHPTQEQEPRRLESQTEPPSRATRPSRCCPRRHPVIPLSTANLKSETSGVISLLPLVKKLYCKNTQRSHKKAERALPQLSNIPILFHSALKLKKKKN